MSQSVDVTAKVHCVLAWREAPSLCVCPDYTRYWGLTWSGQDEKRGSTCSWIHSGGVFGAWWVFLENVQYELLWRPSTFLYRTLLSRHLTGWDRGSEEKTVTAHWGMETHTHSHLVWTCTWWLTCLIPTQSCANTLTWSLICMCLSCMAEVVWGPLNNSGS